MSVLNARWLKPALVAVFGIAVAGCSGDPQMQPKVGLDDKPAPKLDKKPEAKADTATPTSGSVQIDDKITKACGDLPTSHFAFDSASVGPDAGGALEALARCFTTGPLKGRGMRLVGHADPRGETEYNFALGQKRAGSVGAYLTTKGVDKSHIDTTSKGALEATGTDEEGWARDRKVDVVLVE